MMSSAHTSKGLKSLTIIGGVAALLQLVTLFAMMIVMATLGPKPTTAEGYFNIQQNSGLEMVLRGDFLTLILIGLYLGTFPALYVALRRISPIYVSLAALFTFIVVVGMSPPIPHFRCSTWASVTVRRLPPHSVNSSWRREKR